ncbi:MAG TPA: ATP-dependent metallopeptidase FtsH/Yme1/Tma family protein [Clostridiales bacterium]|nr:ATP-dependent metallopeptidase FtsH/Yme1/Tma family protein [Clostridiales bacterium]
MKKFLRGPGFYLLLLLVIIFIVSTLGDTAATKEEISYPELLEAIEANKVERIQTIETTVIGLYRGSYIKEKDFLSGGKYDFRSRIITRESFYEDIKKIEAKKTGRPVEDITASDFSFTIDVKPPPEAPWWLNLLPFGIVIILFGLFWFFFMQQTQGGGGGNRVMTFGKSRAKVHTDSKRRTTFRDVAGADEEKEELREIVDFLKNPRKYIELGARIPKGVLLVGPPGTGKTLLARAVAGEAGVPFFTISGSDFVEMFVGVGASRVRDLFDQAKKNSPCIVFIDEIDAVGRHRGAGLGGGHDEREQTLNQLLVEMDGFSDNEGIIILAATNRPDILDPALLRPGRFDRRVLVGVPDVKGREEIIKVHARGKPLSPEVDIKVLAKRTPGFTGADIENMMNEAAILVARRSGREIEMQDLEEAITRVIAGPEKRSRVITEKDKKLVAYHEAGHAVVAKLLPNADPVHEISIIPRGMAGGYTLTLPEQDKYYVSKSEMLDDITQLLGGRVAEALVLNDISTGASNDIERASNMARKMVTEYGMSENLGPITYGGKHEEVFLGRDFSTHRNYSEHIASAIDNEVRNIIQTAYSKAEQLLSDHLDGLHRVAQALLDREKLDMQEFEEIFAGA